MWLETDGKFSAVLPPLPAGRLIGTGTQASPLTPRQLYGNVPNDPNWAALICLLPTGLGTQTHVDRVSPVERATGPPQIRRATP